MDRKLVRRYTEIELSAAVERLANELDRNYRRRFPVFVGILRGPFVSLADLVRQLKTPLPGIEFLGISSYGSAMVSSGTAGITMGVPLEAVVGRELVVIKDIVDTGITTTTALRYLKRHGPASMSVCALLNKPSRRQGSVKAGYVGLTVPDRFIVGYGIDLDRKYRQLPEIYTLEE